MNTDTGEIRMLEALEQLAGNEVLLRCEPDPNCPKCYGRGHNGRNITTGKYVPCSCTQKRKSEASHE